MTISKDDLRRETRDWLKKGVIPSEAARFRRDCAAHVATDDAREYHLAVAAEWDRIAATQPEKVIRAYEAKRDYHLGCIEAVAKMGHLDAEAQEAHRVSHMEQACKWDRLILDIDPEYQPR